MRVHVVANRTARGLSREPRRLAALATIARGRASLVETGAVAELEPVMERAVREGADLVVLAGGDGTFMAGISALHRALVAAGEAEGRPRAWPRVGLLPMGTVGTIARNLGERGRAEPLLERWLSAPDSAHAWPRPTLRVRATSASGVEERIGFIVGTGLVARFFEVYEARGAGGIPLAGRIVARVFAESFAGGPLARQILDPIPCTLEVDGEERHRAGLSLLCAAVVRDLGLGMKVCYRAAERPDRVHLVASALPPQRLGPRAPRVVLGRTIGGERHVDELATRFAVRFPDEGPYVLDGDSFRARSFEVAPGPLVPILGPREV